VSCFTTVNTIGESFSVLKASKVVDLGQAAVFLNVSCLREPSIWFCRFHSYKYGQFDSLSSTFSTFPQLFPAPTPV
jgi:hypothetical protein